MHTPIMLILTSMVLCALGFLQFNERGPLLNNAYIFASEQERKTMNKQPFYRQSGVCFVLLGIMFLLLALALLITGWLIYLFWVVAFITLAYAIVSSIKLKEDP